MDLADGPRGANYVVGVGVQDVFGGGVVDHEGVGTGGTQVVRAPYHGGALVPEYGFQHLQKLVDLGFPLLLDDSPLRGPEGPAGLLPEDHAREFDPLEEELYDRVGRLPLHGAPYDYPPEGKGSLQETAEAGTEVNELALDVRGEPVVVHPLGRGERHSGGPGTVDALDEDPVEVENQESSLVKGGRGAKNRAGGYAMRRTLWRRAKVVMLGGYARCIRHNIYSRGENKQIMHIVHEGGGGAQTECISQAIHKGAKK